MPPIGKKKSSMPRIRMYVLLAAASIAILWVLSSRSGPMQSTYTIPDELAIRMRQGGTINPEEVQAVSPEDIRRKVGSADAAFLEPPESPFYKYPVGKLSPFGFEAMTVLQSVVNRGGINGEGLMMDIVDAVESAAGSEEYINNAARKVASAVHAGKRYPDAAPHDNQLHALVKLPIVVARYVGQPELREKVLEAVHSQQKGPEAEQYALLMATVLEQALLGTIATRDTLAAVELAADAAAKEADGGAARLMVPISDAMERLKELRTGGVEDKIRAVQEYGASCHMPGALLATLALLAKPTPYVDAVRGDILAGGDSAGRAHCIGALLGAQQGEGTIPEDWRAKVSALGRIEELTEALLEQRFASR